jgi:hypothetical protein
MHKNRVVGATLAAMAAGLPTGCGEVSFTGPTLPSGLPQGSRLASIRTLEIVGSLRAEQGSCVEATILYDGEELVGGRTACVEGPGCTELELTAFARGASGHHTISFLVLRQSPEAVAYLATGTVRVSREDVALGWPGMSVSLEPTRATLRSGESVNFDVDFRD